MNDRIEKFYFETSEVRNTDNLKNVLEALGSETDLETPLDTEIRAFAHQVDSEWSEVYDEQSYVLDDNVSARYLETDEGVFIASESYILSENTRSMSSRSTAHQKQEV